MIKTRLNLILEIDHPIIQEGIRHTTGTRLIQTVSEGGGLGVLASDHLDSKSLYFEIMALKEIMEKPFGVSVCLEHEDAEKLIQVIIDEKVKVAITGKGSPARFTSRLRENGIKVIHEVTNVEEAKAAEDAGVDAVVARGAESGGYSGPDQIGSMVLTSLVADAVKMPVIACGGLSDGRTLPAALSLGAEGIQIGSRFTASFESSAHENYKKALIKNSGSDTLSIALDNCAVRLLKNKFSLDLKEMQLSGISKEDLKKELSDERFKQGMNEGDVDNGALIADQGIGSVKSVKSARDIIREIVYEVMIIGDQFMKFKPRLRNPAE